MLERMRGYTYQERRRELLKKRTGDNDDFNASRDGELNTATMVNGVVN